MSWTDKSSIRAITEIRDRFKVRTLVETGTFKGINARLQSIHFDEVITVEKERSFFDTSKKKLELYPNVVCINHDSALYLRQFVKDYRDSNRTDYVIFYLDAHYYDPELPEGEGKFVVLRELQALKGFDKAIIIIHDFDNNLGHITYDNIPLNFDLLAHDLFKVNEDFSYQVNELSSCDIVTKEEVIAGRIAGLEPDFETLHNLDYAWSKPEKTYRGILYCLPKNVVITGLKQFI